MKSSLVLLDAFPSALIAEMVKDRLDAEGIPAFVDGANTAAVFAGAEAVVGGARVMVAPEDLEEARGVLANLSHPLGSATADLSEEELAVLAARATPEEAASVEEEPPGGGRSLKLLLWIAGGLALFLVILRILRRVHVFG